LTTNNGQKLPACCRESRRTGEGARRTTVSLPEPSCIRPARDARGATCRRNLAAGIRYVPAFPAGRHTGYGTGLPGRRTTPPIRKNSLSVRRPFDPADTRPEHPKKRRRGSGGRPRARRVDHQDPRLCRCSGEPGSPDPGGGAGRRRDARRGVGRRDTNRTGRGRHHYKSERTLGINVRRRFEGLWANAGDPPVLPVPAKIG